MGESVAEHIFGMCILANYFLPLEDTKNESDRAKVYDLITWHDIDEVETGDVMGYKKTDADRERAISAVDTVIGKSPDFLKDRINVLVKEYENQKTFEARFVKGLDKIDVLVQIFTESGRTVFERNKTTREQHDSVKKPYVENWPVMKRFNDVVSDRLELEGFYWVE